MASTFEAVRAEALFVSCLQPSQRPAGDEVRTTVAAILRAHGIRGCAAAVAAEFGHHPDCAVARMGWALSTVRSVYPAAPGGLNPSRAA
jgi:hypothetical protein